MASGSGFFSLTRQLAAASASRRSRPRSKQEFVHRSQLIYDVSTESAYPERLSANAATSAP